MHQKTVICAIQLIFIISHLAFTSIINADFCVAGCLIAYGALLGKVSPVQLMILTLFGITLFAVEEYIILHVLHVSSSVILELFIYSELLLLNFIIWLIKTETIYKHFLLLEIK